MTVTYETEDARETKVTATTVPVEKADTGSRDRLWIVLALLALYLIWGSTYLGIRIAIEPGGFPPFLMAGLRFLIAGGGMYLFLRLRGTPGPTRSQWIGSILVGTFLLVGGNGGVTFAEQWVPSGLAALGVGATPLWAALFAGLWGRWPVKLEWLGLILGFVGVGLLNLDEGVNANPLGALGILLASMSWAFGSVWSRRLSLPDGMMSPAAQMLAGGVMLTTIGLVSGERMTTIPTGRPLWAFIYLIVFGALVAYTAYIYLLGKVRPTVATSYAYVNPIVAVALGVWLAGETITVFGMAAMVVILAGVGLLALSRERTQPEAKH